MENDPEVERIETLTRERSIAPALTKQGAYVDRSVLELFKSYVPEYEGESGITLTSGDVDAVDVAVKSFLEKNPEIPCLKLSDKSAAGQKKAVADWRSAIKRWGSAAATQRYTNDAMARRVGEDRRAKRSK